MTSEKSYVDVDVTAMSLWLIKRCQLFISWMTAFYWKTSTTSCNMYDDWIFFLSWDNYEKNSKLLILIFSLLYFNVVISITIRPKFVVFQNFPYISYKNMDLPLRCHHSPRAPETPRGRRRLRSPRRRRSCPLPPNQLS